MSTLSALKYSTLRSDSSRRPFQTTQRNYGHQTGDMCLRAVAQAIESTAQRPFDLAARYGGEELVRLLPNTDFQGAIEIAQRTLAAVNNLKLEHAHSRASNYVFISVGVATVIPNSQFSAEELIATADQQLYAAKDNGRNQFSAAVMPM